MRIKVMLSSSNQELPINSQSIVNSFIHRVLGKDNIYHNRKNDYSVSSLQGGKWIKNTENISFMNGGYITITSNDNDFLNTILLNLYTTPFHNDIKVIGMEFVDEKMYNGWNHFATLSPFLIKERREDGKYTFLTLDMDNFEDKVKNYLINKLSKINPKLDLKNFDVKIDTNHKSNKIKKVLVKNVINKANQCQISINCRKEVAELIYTIGIGQSTGSGFGTVYKTENHKLYR